MDETQQIRERLVAVEMTLAHLRTEVASLRQDMQDFRDTREPYKKLIWGAVGAIGLFLVLERLKVFERLIRP